MERWKKRVKEDGRIEGRRKESAKEVEKWGGIKRNITLSP